MGKFKDEHGKSRVGLFLQEVAPQLLEKVGDISGIPGLSMLGNLITNDPNLSPHHKQKALELLQVDLEFEKELTERHKTDMTSDSWLSKNIRPMTLIFMLVLLATTMSVDSALEGFNVPEPYVVLMKYLLVAAFSFYFGGRELQKLILNRKK